MSNLIKTSSQSPASAMKSDGLGTANKPGDGPKTKSVKKPGDRSVASKAKTATSATSVVNGTGAVGARREVVSANGPRSSSGGKDQEKRPNPGARPKTSPPSCTSTSQTSGSKVQKISAVKTNSTTGSTPAQATATSTSGSASPENGASSPRNDAQSVPGAKPKQPAKAVNKSTPTKAPQKVDSAKSSSSTNKMGTRETSKVKTGAAEKATTGVTRADSKGRATTENHVPRNGSLSKKPASPKKDNKEGSKPSSDKTASEAPKKKTTKPIAATVSSTKPSAKPAKPSSVNSKQPPAPTAKPGPKPKTESAASPKSGSNTKTLATKKVATKDKEVGNLKSEPTQIRTEEKDKGNKTEQQGTLPSSKGEGDSVKAPNPKECPQSENGKNTENDTSVESAAKPTSKIKSTNADFSKPPLDTKSKQPQSIPSHTLNSNPNPDTERPIDTPCSIGSTPLDDSWSGLHPQITPESETGSQSTSSDDIKPRSEDYDAGGSQDDDCSNDRGVSKCGTMRCHDFLGRSSSDTSTPEELKMYESGAGLRVEVRLRGREAETTSEEEGVRQRPRSWLQRDEAHVEEVHSEVEATVTVKSVPEHQLFSSEEEEDDDDEEEETEDEKSEVEVLPNQGSHPNTEPSPHFQGIVNLAFDDESVDQENEPSDFQTTSNFRRSVLLSVDECEELGTEEAGIQTPPPKHDAATPSDVFEPDTTVPQSDPSEEQNLQASHVETALKLKTNELQEEKSSVFLTELQEQVENSHCPPQDPPQERPCHLDLRHAEQYTNGSPRKHPSESKKADLHLDLNEPQLTPPPSQGAQSPAGKV